MRTIYLIGMPGAGKTTIGRRLARLLQRSFQDTDHLIEHKYNLPVAEIIDQHGIDIFRKIEHELLQELTEIKTPSVVATGGGFPLQEDHMDQLKSMGLVIYIRSKAGIMHSRIIANERRGKLSKISLTDYETLLEERKMIYEQAHIIADICNENKPEEKIKTCIDQYLSQERS